VHAAVVHTGARVLPPIARPEPRRKRRHVPPAASPRRLEPPGAHRAAEPVATDDSGTPAGVVRGLRERTEQSDDQRSEHVVTFRIERHDARGAPLQPIPVEMRGRRFEGVIQEGDWVELPPDWRPGATMRVRRVHNLSTGSSFTARGDSGAVKVAKVVVGLVAIAFILLIAVWIATEALSGDSFPEVPELPDPGGGSAPDPDFPAPDPGSPGP
jgi:hypothetical protein